MSKFKETLTVKFLSIIVSVSLMITSLQGLAFSMPAPVNIVPSVMQQTGQINTNIIPFNVGRVTETLYNGSGRVLVTIQDLHSHRQTQENINEILKILDKKYGIKNIWLEGASGTLDTSWLANISDKKTKEQVTETLLSNGRLTGAELFSVQTNKTGIIKGLENEKVYLKNFKRLNEIYSKKKEIESYLPEVKAILNVKINNYFSTENKKINALQEKNKNNKIKTDKYFKNILRAVNKTGINLADYKQVAKYVYITEKQKEINFKKVNKEIGNILKELKEILNYGQYKNIIDKANKKETETDFYIEIKKLAEEKEILGKYNNAKKFFEYISYSEMLNPIELAEQEEELINDIQTRLARTGYEKEVLFLKRYFRLIENYLSNKITADEYKYFKNNEQRFKTLWTKYVDVDGIININEYFDLFEDFYKDNVERNRYFIENITGTKPAKEKDAILIKASDDYNSHVMEELAKEKDGIDVVITGGFHTRGLSRLFEEEKINYIVITPNVTDETATSEKLYENMYRQEYEIIKEKFALMPVSELIKNRMYSVIDNLNELENIRVVGETVIFDFSDGDTLEIGKEDFDREIDREKKKRNRLFGTFFDNLPLPLNKQANFIADTFLELQKYLKLDRENKRKILAGKRKTDISAMQEKLVEKIEKISDTKIRRAFIEKLNVTPNFVERYQVAIDVVETHIPDIPEELLFKYIVEMLKIFEYSYLFDPKHWSWTVLENFFKQEAVPFIKIKLETRKENLDYMLDAYSAEFAFIRNRLFEDRINFYADDIWNLKKTAKRYEEIIGRELSEGTHRFIDFLVDNEYTVEELKTALGIEFKKYSLFQSDRTVERLEKFAKFLKLKNPEQFRYNPFGVALGTIIEWSFFWEKAFPEQHRNWTDKQEKAWTGLKISSVIFGIAHTAYLSVFINPFISLAVIGIIATYSIIFHFLYNEIQILTGNKKYILQTDKLSSDKNIQPDKKTKKRININTVFSIVFGLTGFMLFAIPMFNLNVWYNDIHSDYLENKFIEIAEESKIDDVVTIRMQNLQEVLKQNFILSDKGKENNISVYETILSKDFERIFMSDIFIDYCNKKNIDVLQQYNLTINILRKIHSFYGKNFSNISDDDFNDVLVKTLIYYEQLSAVADKIKILDDETSVFCLNGAESLENGSKRFSSVGTLKICKMLDIHPAAFETVDLYDVPKDQYKQNIETVFDKIINFEGKAVFVFNSHGTDTKFLYGTSLDFPYFDSFSADKFADVLIESYKKGNLGNKTFVFTSCYSDEFSKIVKKKLQEEGITNLPNIIIAVSEETDNGYDSPYDNEYISNLAISVLKYVDGAEKGVLTLRQIADAPMIFANQTVFFSNEETEILNRKYEQDVRKNIGSGKILQLGVYSTGVYSALQSDRTVERLEKFAKFLRLKNPEQFRYNPFGVALGTMIEWSSFWEKAFPKQHRNWTDKQEKAWTGLKISSVVFGIAHTAYLSVFINPFISLAVIGIIAAYSIIFHFLYNEIQILTGNKEYLLQSEVIEDDVKIYRDSKAVEEEDGDVKVYVPVRKRRADRYNGEKFFVQQTAVPELSENTKSAARRYLDRINYVFGITPDIKGYVVKNVSGVDMYNITSFVEDKTERRYENFVRESYPNLRDLEDLFKNFATATDLGRKENGGRQEGLYVDLQGYEGEIIVIGDIHAQLPKLLQKIEANREKLENGEAIIVFEGDYIHREDEGRLGEMFSSMVTIQFLMNLKILYPKSVYMLAGNHDIGQAMGKGNVPQGPLFYQALDDFYGRFTGTTLFEPAMRKNLALAAETDDYIIVHAGPLKSETISVTRGESKHFGWRSFLRGERRIQNIRTDSDYVSIHGQLLWNRYDSVFNDEDIRAFAGDKILIHGHHRTGKFVIQNTEINGEKRSFGGKINNFYEDIADNHLAVIDANTDKANGYGVISQKYEQSAKNITLLQTEKTQRILFKIAEFLKIEHPELFRFSLLGILLTPIFEPQIAFSPKFYELHKGKTKDLSISRYIIIAADAISFVIAGRIARDLFPAFAVAFLCDYILHCLINYLKVEFKKQVSDFKEYKREYAMLYGGEGEEPSAENISEQVSRDNRIVSDVREGNSRIASAVTDIMQRYDDYGKTGKIAGHIFSYSNFYDGVTVSIAGKINSQIALKLFVSKDGSARISGFTVRTVDGKIVNVPSDFSIQDKESLTRYLQKWNYGRFAINSYDIGYFVSEIEKILYSFIETPQKRSSLLQSDSTVERLENFARFLNLKNPEDFRYNLFGVALGVFFEQKDLISIVNGKLTEEDFLNEHFGVTDTMITILSDIITSATDAGEKAYNMFKFFPALANLSSRIAVEISLFLNHFSYNRKAISYGKKKDVLQTGETDNNIASIYKYDEEDCDENGCPMLNDDTKHKTLSLRLVKQYLNNFDNGDRFVIVRKNSPSGNITLNYGDIVYLRHPEYANYEIRLIAEKKDGKIKMQKCFIVNPENNKTEDIFNIIDGNLERVIQEYDGRFDLYEYQADSDGIPVCENDAHKNGYNKLRDFSVNALPNDMYCIKMVVNPSGNLNSTSLNFHFYIKDAVGKEARIVIKRNPDGKFKATKIFLLNDDGTLYKKYRCYTVKRKVFIPDNFGKKGKDYEEKDVYEKEEINRYTFWDAVRVYSIAEDTGEKNFSSLEFENSYYNYYEYERLLEKRKVSIKSGVNWADFIKKYSSEEKGRDYILFTRAGSFSDRIFFTVLSFFGKKINLPKEYVGLDIGLRIKINEDGTVLLKNLYVFDTGEIINDEYTISLNPKILKQYRLNDIGDFSNISNLFDFVNKISDKVIEKYDVPTYEPPKYSSAGDIAIYSGEEIGSFSQRENLNTNNTRKFNFSDFISTFVATKKMPSNPIKIGESFSIVRYLNKSGSLRIFNFNMGNPLLNRIFVFYFTVIRSKKYGLQNYKNKKVEIKAKFVSDGNDIKIVYEKLYVFDEDNETILQEYKIFWNEEDKNWQYDLIMPEEQAIENDIPRIYDVTDYKDDVVRDFSAEGIEYQNAKTDKLKESAFCSLYDTERTYILVSKLFSMKKRAATGLSVFGQKFLFQDENTEDKIAQIKIKIEEKKDKDGSKKKNVVVDEIYITDEAGTIYARYKNINGEFIKILTEQEAKQRNDSFSRFYNSRREYIGALRNKTSQKVAATILQDGDFIVIRKITKAKTRLNLLGSTLMYFVDPDIEGRECEFDIRIENGKIVFGDIRVLNEDGSVYKLISAEQLVVNKKSGTLQSDGTVERLEDSARFLKLKNPENFRYNPFGVALGTIIEWSSFWEKAFPEQHRNWTDKQEKAWTGLKISSVIFGMAHTAYLSVFINPVISLLVIGIIAAYSIIFHFLYNEIQILTGNKEYVLQTEETDNNVASIYEYDEDDCDENGYPLLTEKSMQSLPVHKVSDFIYNLKDGDSFVIRRNIFSNVYIRLDNENMFSFSNQKYIGYEIRLVGKKENGKVNIERYYVVDPETGRSVAAFKYINEKFEEIINESEGNADIYEYLVDDSGVPITESSVHKNGYTRVTQSSLNNLSGEIYTLKTSINPTGYLIIKPLNLSMSFQGAEGKETRVVIRRGENGEFYINRIFILNDNGSVYKQYRCYKGVRKYINPKKIDSKGKSIFEEREILEKEEVSRYDFWDALRVYRIPSDTEEENIFSNLSFENSYYNYYEYQESGRREFLKSGTKWDSFIKKYNFVGERREYIVFTTIGYFPDQIPSAILSFFGNRINLPEEYAGFDAGLRLTIDEEGKVSFKNLYIFENGQVINSEYEINENPEILAEVSFETGSDSLYTIKNQLKQNTKLLQRNFAPKYMKPHYVPKISRYIAEFSLYLGQDVGSFENRNNINFTGIRKFSPEKFIQNFVSTRRNPDNPIKIGEEFSIVRPLSKKGIATLFNVDKKNISYYRENHLLFTARKYNVDDFSNKLLEIKAKFIRNGDEIKIIYDRAYVFDEDGETILQEYKIFWNEEEKIWHTDLLIGEQEAVEQNISRVYDITEYQGQIPITDFSSDNINYENARRETFGITDFCSLYLPGRTYLISTVINSKTFTFLGEYIHFNDDNVSNKNAQVKLRIVEEIDEGGNKKRKIVIDEIYILDDNGNVYARYKIILRNRPMPVLSEQEALNKGEDRLYIQEKDFSTKRYLSVFPIRILKQDFIDIFGTENTGNKVFLAERMLSTTSLTFLGDVLLNSIPDNLQNKKVLIEIKISGNDILYGNIYDLDGNLLIKSEDLYINKYSEEIKRNKSDLDEEEAKKGGFPRLYIRTESGEVVYLEKLPKVMKSNVFIRRYSDKGSTFVVKKTIPKSKFRLLGGLLLESSQKSYLHGKDSEVDVRIKDGKIVFGNLRVLNEDGSVFETVPAEELAVNKKTGALQSDTDAKDANIGLIESEEFLYDMIYWINVNFAVLLDMFKSGKVSAEEIGLVFDENTGKITGFVNEDYENIARAMAKEINRRLASRDGYFKFSKDEKDEKGYERYNRVKEGVLQILTRNLYGNIVVNEWIYSGDFNVEANRTAYQMAYSYLTGIINKIKEITDEEYDSSTKNLTWEDKIKLNEILRQIMAYKMSNVSRLTVEAETEKLAVLVGNLINLSEELGIDLIGDKKTFVYSAAPGTGKDELAGRIFGNDGVLGKYLDPSAKMKILHTRDLRPSEIQADKYVFFDPKVLIEYGNGEGAGVIKVVYVNGQPQGFVLSSQADIPVYKVDYNKGKVTNVKGDYQSVNGLDTLYNTKKLSRLEGGLAIVLEVMRQHSDSSFTFISPFTEEQIIVRGRNNKIIAENFIGARQLRLAHECMLEMIAENKGEIDLNMDGNLEKLISKVEKLSGEKILPKTTNIYATYKVSEVTDTVCKKLKARGINNIMIDVTSVGQNEIEKSIFVAKLMRMNVTVFGEGAENIDIEGISVAVSENPKENQKRVVSYNQALQMKGDLSKIIVNIARTENENILLTQEDILNLINMGALISFDETVLREVSKENTARNGITMFDLIARTSAEKSAKETTAEFIQEEMPFDRYISDILDISTDKVHALLSAA